MNAPEFAPTHRIVADGAHDANGLPLDPHLPVEVREISSGWAAIRCSNGWETWIGATALEPLANHRRVRPMVVIGAVAAVVAALVAVVMARGGGERDGTTLQFPTEWATSPDGRMAARDAADLSAQVPAGPRIRQEPAANPDISTALFSMTDGTPARLVAGPGTTTVGGSPAVTIELVESLDGTDVHRIYVLLRKEASALMWVLEAPESQWNSGAGADLAAILAESR